MHVSRARLVALAVAVLVAAGAALAAGSFVGTAKSGARQQAPPPRTSPPAVAAPSGPVSVASGSAQRTFVSANHGNDANPCPVTLPCRNFAAAIAQAAPGGEVIVLDSGVFAGVHFYLSLDAFHRQCDSAGALEQRMSF